MKKHKRAAKSAEKSSSIPIPVRVISIVYFVQSGIVLLLALFILLATIFVSEDKLQGTILTIIVFIAGILYFIIGRNLRKAKNWARLVAIAFAIVGLFGNGYALVFSMTSSIILALLLVAANALIIYYLTRKNVVQFFK